MAILGRWSARDAEPDPEAILREQPFAPGVRLARVEPLARGEGHSGGAFLALTADGRRMKLRVCRSPAEARRTAGWLERLPHVFPRVEARAGRFLLVEYLEGERLERKDLRPYASRLGRICAEVHRLEEPRGWSGRLLAAREAWRLRLNFGRQLRALRRHGVIDADTAARVRDAWRAWLQRHGIEVCLDLFDTHKANFMLDGEGALRYVDEEGIGYTLRGMGLAKLLAKPGARPNAPKRLREWFSFCQGYAEVADASYLTPEYCTYVRLIELVRSLEFKLRRERRLFKVEAELEELHALVDRVKPPAGSSDPPVVPSCPDEGGAGPGAA